MYSKKNHYNVNPNKTNKRKKKLVWPVWPHFFTESRELGLLHWVTFPWKVKDQDRCSDAVDADVSQQGQPAGFVVRAAFGS